MQKATPLTTDTSIQEYGGEPIIGYRKRQVGCLGIWLFITGILILIGGIVALLAGSDSAQTPSNIVRGIVFSIIALGMIWIQVEDRGDHLLLTTGPCRWALCGCGKEKIPYSNIRDYGVTQTCFYGHGVHCSAVKLFNQCSCCCGDNISRCCGHKTIRLTINERAQGLGAKDTTDCCCESMCLSCFCGENGHWIGKGCCFQPCCNPCNANCCAMNTVFISTNDPNGFMGLLNQKVQSNG
eukprot:UN10044